MKEVISCSDPIAEPDFELAAMYWRGACMDLFSQSEKLISVCLEHLRDCKHPLDEESLHPGAAARLRSLLKALEKSSFSGHERMARKILQEWQELALHRPYLAHGIFAVEQHAAVVHLIEYLKGGRERHPPRRYSKKDMEDLLADLEKGVRRLSSQLAQIRAASVKQAA